MAVPLGLFGADTCSAEEAGQPFVRLYDTGTPSSAPLSGAAVAAKRGWKEIAGVTLDHVFQGDAALLNDRLLLIFRACTDGADVYSASAAGFTFRTGLAAYPAAQPWTDRLASTRLLENNSGAVMVDATYKTGDGRSVAVRYRLAAGQAILEVRPGDGAESLVVLTDGGPLVVPDFFGDDMVFAGDLRNHEPVGLPAENMFLNLMDGGNAIAMYVWQARNLQVKAGFGKHPGVLFSGCESRDVKGKSIWVAFLEGKGLWRELSVPSAEAGKVLDWKPPFAAKWRADLIRGSGFAESVTFEWLPSAGWAMPALKAGKHVIYPIDRSKATPLTEFTPVDILRNTLGVGPCQYILETEGLATADNPTPDQVMTWVEKQLKKKGGKDAADDIRERLKAMVELAGRTEARIKRYADFAAEMKQLLASDNSETGLKLKVTADAIAQAAAAGLAATQPPGRVAKLADAVAGLIGKDTAAADLAAPAADLRSIGAAQDRALAKSRMAVRWLGCQAPASEIAKRTEAFLQGK